MKAATVSVRRHMRRSPGRARGSGFDFLAVLAERLETREVAQEPDPIKRAASHVERWARLSPPELAMRVESWARVEGLPPNQIEGLVATLAAPTYEPKES